MMDEEVLMNDAIWEDGMRSYYRRVVVEHYKVRVEVLSYKSDFYSDLAGDSLDIVDLVVGLEDKFGISIDEGKISGYNVGKLEDEVVRQKRQLAI